MGEHTPKAWICRHPTVVLHSTNLVTGEDTAQPLPCWTNRHLCGPCGEEGRHWEPLDCPAGFV